MEQKPILLVEDNPDDELMSLRALRKLNMSNPVVVARDGAEALDLILGRGPHQGQPLTPMVILLDLKLPKVSGLEVLRQIRTTDSTSLIPVVILTSSNEPSDLQEGYRLGVNSYVCKPVEGDAFQAAVAQLGMYWILLNHGPT